MAGLIKGRIWGTTRNSSGLAGESAAAAAAAGGRQRMASKRMSGSVGSDWSSVYRADPWQSRISGKQAA